MSETTKPYDPWKATNDDLEVYLSAPLMPLTGSLQAAFDRVRARVEAYQAAAAKPATHHDKPWIKIGDRIVKTESIHEVWLNGGTWLMRQSGMCSTPLTGPEADALWAHFADPVRCVDLTPAVATTTPSP